MNIRTDILGRTPTVGDTIVFNPPKYKGLIHGTCIGFKEGSGLPMVGRLNSRIFDSYDENGEPYYTPKTGFVIAPKTAES